MGFMGLRVPVGAGLTTGSQATQTADASHHMLTYNPKSTLRAVCIAGQPDGLTVRQLAKASGRGC